MKVYREITLKEFDPWAGAIENYKRILEADKEEEFESYIEEVFPEGLSETQLNDILWFDFELIADYIGLFTYQLIDVKLVEDEEGYHPYIWYKRSDGKHIFMYDDTDPDIDYCDWECESEEEAKEWFEAYTTEFEERKREG